MEAVKKERKVLRTAFTKTLSVFWFKMEADCTKEDKLVAFQFLETKMTKLDAAHETYNRAVFGSTLE